ncbi:MAG: ATP-binding cassette domain-containing protein [Ignavibacteriales bacterium]|nr:ATP-binding cassette domain-containing protein [Ignavibacteriales bacterium]
MIKISDIVITKGESLILNSVSLKINRCETHVIVGPSGAGKSSIIKVISGLWKPDRGSVVIDGVEISSLSENEIIPIRRKIGIVFQGNALFDSLTVEENVSFFLREHRKLTDKEINKRTTNAISTVNMNGTEKLYIDELSGGMKKRVAIARALAFQPDIILYDEPTNGLDPINAKAVLDLITKVKNTCSTSVVVTHILNDALMIADKITVINQGEIIESGDLNQILNSPNKFVQDFFSGIYPIHSFNNPKPITHSLSMK